MAKWKSQLRTTENACGKVGKPASLTLELRVALGTCSKRCFQTIASRRFYNDRSPFYDPQPSLSIVFGFRLYQFNSLRFQHQLEKLTELGRSRDGWLATWESRRLTGRCIRVFVSDLGCADACHSESKLILYRVFETYIIMWNHASNLPNFCHLHQMFTESLSGKISKL